MDILPFTQEHHEFRERVAEYLAANVTPHANQYEKDHLVPKEIWKQMGEQGFLCTAADKKYGGMGGDFLYSFIMVEEVSRVKQCGLATSLHSDIVVPYIEAFGSEEQKAKYIPGCVSGDIITAVAMTEPGAGSDLSSLSATAVDEGDEIVLNGAKTFISNGINCDLVVVAAKDPAVDNPYESISLFLVEDGTPGFNKGTKLEKMGMHAQDTAELFFTNCRIPKENRLGEKGQGFLMLMQKLQQERLVCAIMGVTAAERILEEVTEYCKTTTNRAGKPLSKEQAVQFALVEMATEAKIGRTFTEKLVMDHMEKRDVVVEVSMAKYWCTEMVNRLADRALDLMGFDGINDNGMARAWRDVRVWTIFAGANEIMKTIAGRFMGL